MLKPFDDVNGVIIGDVSFTYAIVSPKGKTQKQFWANNDNQAICIFQQWKAEKLAECSGREVIMEMIYGKGEWEVRQYVDCDKVIMGKVLC